MENTKPKFRGRFKFSLCKWLRINNKIYTENDEENNGLNIMVSFLINGTEAPVSVSTFLQRVR